MKQIIAAPAMASVYQEKLGFTKKVPWLVYKVQVTNVNFSELQSRFFF